MAVIRRTDTPAQTGPGIPDDALGPGEEASFEAELEHAEQDLRLDRERRFLRDNPDGIGPTLGQDLGGHDAHHGAHPGARHGPRHGPDWNDPDYDPPT